LAAAAAARAAAMADNFLFASSPLLAGAAA